MNDEKRIVNALKSSAGMTLLLRVIAALWGFTLQTMPGIMESPGSYDSDWASNLSHWDPSLERLIILWGYEPQSVLSAKYPLYAMLTRMLMQVTGLKVETAMFWMTTIGTFFCFFALYLLLDYIGKEAFASRALWYMPFSIIGTGFVFMMSFPEAFHIGFWSLAFLFFFKKEDLLASFMVSFAVLTRPQSVLLLPLFALSVVIKERDNVNLLIVRGVKACGLPTIVYIVWTWWVSKLTEVALSPIEAQDYFRRATRELPWMRAHHWFDWLRYNNPTNYRWGPLFETYHLAIIGVGLIVLAYLVWQKRLRWEPFIFSLLSISLPLSTHVYAIGRFALATWIPFAFMELVPERYDKHFIAFGAALNIIVMFVLGVSTGGSWAMYVP